MIRLIRAANFKIRKSSYIYILVVITMVLIFGGVCLFYGALRMMSDGSMFELAGGYDTDIEAFDNLNFIDCTSIVLSLMQILSIIIAIAVTINISEDKANGSMIVAASKGSARMQIYGSRIYETVILSFILYLTEIIAAGAAGAIFWHGDITGDNVIAYIKIIIVTMLMYITAGIIFMNVALCIKSGGAAIAINILVFVFGISVFFTALDTSINGDVGVIREYWIFTAIEQFADVDITWLDILKAALNIIIYGGLSTLIGGSHFCKSELR